MSDITQALNELERITELFVKHRTPPMTGAQVLSMPAQSWQAEAQTAQALAAYVSYKVQDATFTKLSEQVTFQVEGLKAQSATIAELKRQADLTKRQADLTKWLVIATTVLAASTAALALLTYLK